MHWLKEIEEMFKNNLNDKAVLSLTLYLPLFYSFFLISSEKLLLISLTCFVFFYMIIKILLTLMNKFRWNVSLRSTEIVYVASYWMWVKRLKMLGKKPIESNATVNWYKFKMPNELTLWAIEFYELIESCNVVCKGWSK